MSYIHRPLNYISDKKYKKDFKFNKSLFRKLVRDKTSKYLQLLPKRIDHTPNMTPVKDQGQLGSCVAFSLAALKEWQETQEFLKYNLTFKHLFKTNPFHDLSEQWIYYKTKENDNIQGQGTTIRAALQTLAKYGVPLEKSWLYNDHYKGTPNEDAIITARCTKIGQYFRIKSLKELKLALLHTPVPIGIMIFNTFYSVDHSGIVSLPNSTSKSYGGHAICAVGYDNQTKLIKFKNSWGNQYGENGYGYIHYKYYQKYCLAAWAVTDLTVNVSYLQKIASLL